MSLCLCRYVCHVCNVATRLSCMQVAFPCHGMSFTERAADERKERVYRQVVCRIAFVLPVHIRLYISAIRFVRERGVCLPFVRQRHAFCQLARGVFHTVEIGVDWRWTECLVECGRDSFCCFLWCNVLLSGCCCGMLCSTCRSGVGRIGCRLVERPCAVAGVCC